MSSNLKYSWHVSSMENYKKESYKKCGTLTQKVHYADFIQ